MKNPEDGFGAIAVAGMIILTAWGNAIAMLIGSSIGLLVCLVVFRKKMLGGSALVATVAFAVAGSRCHRYRILPELKWGRFSTCHCIIESRLETCPTLFHTPTNRPRFHGTVIVFE